MIHFIHIAKCAGRSFEKLIKDGTLEGFQYHYHDSRVEKIEGDQMVVLRDPFDRFKSAFWYGKRYPNSLLKRSTHIETPNQLAGLLYHGDPLAWEIIKPRDNDTPWKGMVFTFAPQLSWVNDPKYILHYETLEIDFQNLLKEVGHPPVELPHLNKNPDKELYFAGDGKLFIENFYKEDFEYKESKLKTRIR